mmetsp:Transcript_5791/g.8561  ORF Transcript_5791/g.8561 Transcript_5791/m.8561 type:complete len:482 (+) Transcript_5791:117-1562(+)
MTSDRGITYYSNTKDDAVDLSAVNALRLRSQLTRESTGGLILVMVGLPARGKSFISAKLYSFFHWGDDEIKVFNVGSYRRRLSEEISGGRSGNSDAAFFDSKNTDASEKREALAMMVFDELLEWVSKGRVAIFDATNSTTARRTALVNHATQKDQGVRIVFVESICDDQRVLDANMRAKVKASPDFKGMSFEAGLADLKTRLEHYESRYETVKDNEGCYIKLFNFSSKIHTHLCFGRLAKTLIPFVSAIHTDDRPVYICALPPAKPKKNSTTPKESRLSEPEVQQTDTSSSSSSDDDTDPNLPDLGQRLASFWWGRPRTPCQLQTESRVLVLSSTMPQALAAAETVQNHNQQLVTVVAVSALNPLLITGEHFSHIRDAGTDENKLRDSFKDRGTGGESYEDLVTRLESVVMDIEAAIDPVLVITHATPARALLAYFKNASVLECASPASSPEASALADKEPAVIEIRSSFSGYPTFKIHWI